MADDRNDRRARLRARRRERVRREFDSSVPSPCILVCQLDPRSGFCLGCARSADEIREWMILSAEEKTAILAKLPARKADPLWRASAQGATPREDRGE